MDWTAQLLLQLTWHWEAQLRPRLDGLTDREYLWEPAPGMWSLRPRGRQRTPEATGGGEWVAEIAFPEPDPAPMTTIAWQIAHLLVGIFADRNARHFGAPEVSYERYEYPGTAAQALAELDAGYATWVAGVSALGPQDLEKPCGEEGFESDPMAALILHIHREIIHHGALISSLRDLYAWSSPASTSP